MAKKGKPNYAMWALIGIVALFGASYLGLIQLPTTTQAIIPGTGTDTSTTPITPVAPPVQGCLADTDGKSLNFLVLDEINPGTDLTNDYNAIVYRVSGGTETVLSNAPATTQLTKVACGDQLKIVFTDADSTHDVAGFIETYSVGNEETQVVQVAKGRQDTALSTVVYQSDYITANNGGSPQAYAAAADMKGRLDITASTSGGAWSTAQDGAKLLLVFDYNVITTSKVEVTNVSNGSYNNGAGVPSGHSSTSVVSSSRASDATEITSNVLKDGDELEIKFTASALPTYDPNTDSNIGITIYDKELVKNTDTGVWEIVYRNQVSNADVGETNVTDIFHVS